MYFINHYHLQNKVYRIYKYLPNLEDNGNVYILVELKILLPDNFHISQELSFNQTNELQNQKMEKWNYLNNVEYKSSIWQTALEKTRI